MRPQGYLKTNQFLSFEQAEEIKERWDRAMSNGQTVILSGGIEFVPFERGLLDPSIVLCGHCGQWAAVQTECKHCGAKVI